MDSAATLLYNYLNDVIYDPEHAALDMHQLPEEFQDFGKRLVYFSQCVLEAAELSKSLSRGILDVKLPGTENEITSPLKSLHATLKHLTWQTQQVAKGDYQQRIDFMGDFAEAFNAMTDQLKQRRLGLLREIDSSQREIQQLSQKKNLYELLEEQLTQWILVIDTDTGEYLFSSREVDSIVIDQKGRHQLHQWFLQQIKENGGGDKVRIKELELSVSSGIQYYSVSIHPLLWNNRSSLAFVLNDVSRERERMNNLENIAYFDMLTQRYNRRYCMKVLEKWLEERRSFALCFIDIDNLKYVNDRFGHTEGDRYIIAVSSILSKFSSNAVVCRIGGDEFVLLAAGWNMGETERRLELLRSILSNFDENSVHDYSRNISYGVIAVDSDNTLSADDLLHIADEKMYCYKSRHKKSECCEDRMVLGDRALVKALSEADQNIEELIRMQRENEVLTRRLQAMFDQHNALKVVFDPVTGEIIDANPAICIYFGYTKAEVIGRKVFEFNLLPLEVQEEKLGGELNSKALYYAAPHRLKNGEIRYFDVYASSILDGKQRLLYAILFDSTDREVYREEPLS